MIIWDGTGNFVSVNHQMRFVVLRTKQRHALTHPRNRPRLRRLVYCPFACISRRRDSNGSPPLRSGLPKNDGDVWSSSSSSRRWWQSWHRPFQGKGTMRSPALPMHMLRRLLDFIAAARRSRSSCSLAMSISAWLVVPKDDRGPGAARVGADEANDDPVFHSPERAEERTSVAAPMPKASARGPWVRRRGRACSPQSLDT